MADFKIKLIKSAFLNERATREMLADFVLKTPMFSMSMECKKFEEAFAKKQKRKYAVFVNSGSSANLILIQALLNLGRLKKGDRVGVSAITWSTNVMPLIQLGLEPVAIDCEINTLNISPKTLEKELDGLQGLFLTNVLGFSDDIATIKQMCADKGIVFIEDNCEALGSVVGGVLLGNFGLASTFSFFLGHHLSTLEGGMVVTDDNELYDALVIARAHGWDRNLPRSDQERLRQNNGVDPFYSLYTFYDLGYNVRPSEITGFLGNSQLPHWDEVVQARQDNFKVLQDAIKANDDFIPLKIDHMDIISNFAVPLICKNEALALQYREKFMEMGIEIRPIIAGNITKQLFYKKYVVDAHSYPNADFIHTHGFYCGNNSELDVGEIEILKKAIS